MLGRKRIYIEDKDAYMVLCRMIKLEDPMSSSMCHLTVPIPGTLILPLIPIKLSLQGLGLEMRWSRFLETD